MDGIRGRSSGQQAPLGSEGTLKKTLYEIVSMMITKEKDGSYAASRKIEDWILWRGRPPLKWKRRLHTQ
jgi:hypothetical protein